MKRLLPMEAMQSQCQWPGLELGPPYTESSALTMRPPRLHNDWVLGSYFQYIVGGAVASWLVRSSPDRAVRVRALNPAMD